jgi:hypothetical protein
VSIEYHNDRLYHVLTIGVNWWGLGDLRRPISPKQFYSPLLKYWSFSTKLRFFVWENNTIYFVIIFKQDSRLVYVWYNTLKININIMYIIYFIIYNKGNKRKKLQPNSLSSLQVLSIYNYNCSIQDLWELEQWSSTFLDPRPVFLGLHFSWRT